MVALIFFLLNLGASLFSLAQVWGLGGFCRPNPFPGTAYGTGYTWESGSR